MRSTALSGLIILSFMAACGDSDSDDEKNDDSKVDAGGSDDSNSSNDNGDEELPEIEDDNLDDCDKGDPCCINSEQFDFVRCANADKDAGADAVDAGTAAAN